VEPEFISGKDCHCLQYFKQGALEEKTAAFS